MKTKNLIILVFAIISAGFLIFNSIAIPVYREEIFRVRGTVAIGGELVILIGFLLIGLFNFATIFCLLASVVKKINPQSNIKILILGVFCLIMMFGEKTLIDEISHEYQFGWEAMGEWIIFYLLLSIQLFYILAILKRHRRFINISNGS